MNPLRSRAYAGAADLRRMQDAVAGAYRHTWHRVGDLAWLARDHTHRELALDIRLWETDDGRPVGWTFYRSTGGFLVFALPDWADEALFDDMIRVIEDAAAASVAAGDEPVDLVTYGIDLSRPTDIVLADVLRQHGFIAEPAEGGVLSRRLGALTAPVLPPGYRLSPVDTPELVVGRVEAHRLAFAPSELTVAKYLRLRRNWPYRADLDRVVTTDEGTVVAFCTAWLDERNSAGLLEPVGTHPNHQRLGLGKAVCLDAIAALSMAGAESVQVAYATTAALATYRAIGCEPAGRDTEFRKPR